MSCIYRLNISHDLQFIVHALLLIETDPIRSVPFGCDCWSSFYNLKYASIENPIKIPLFKFE